MIIIHLTDNGHAAWMTAPFNGSGQYHRSADAPAPRDGWQVIARDIPLEDVKDAVFMVSEDEAMDNLARLGCDLIVKKRKTD